MNRKLQVLRIDASGRKTGSSTRTLLDELVQKYKARHEYVDLVRRDLAETIPHVDHDWIEANFTPDENRTTAQRSVLGFSDELVAELKTADTIVIGMPIYNFGVPAALKAWVDMIARARLTFRYTEAGPKGLLDGKKAVLVVASGGVAVDSDFDFATPYMRRALGFVGITDITVICADQQNSRGDDSMDEARMQVADFVHASWPAPAGSHAMRSERA
jgi:FMN-dependent NADH-azoreductase